MIRPRLLAVSALLGVLAAVAGCTSNRADRAAPPSPPDRAARPAEAPAGSVWLRIESSPPGALVVVGDTIAGHAPVTVPVAATPQGFFRERVTIRARFLAADAQHQSTSVRQESTPLEKVPDVIVFTPAGATSLGR